MSCLLFGFNTLSLCGLRNFLINSAAFRPPKGKNYELVKAKMDLIKGQLYKIVLRNAENKKYEPEDPENIESNVVWLETKTKKNIPALYIENSLNRTNTVLLYSHGNSTDLGRMLTNLQDLSLALNVNILAYEYTGYGPSKGSPSEYDVIYGAVASYEFLTNRLRINWTNIILYGRSIGSGPAVYLASHPDYPVSGLILHSPIASALRVLNIPFEKTNKNDMFPNSDFIEHVKSHVFIIHGENDLEVDVSHGKLLATKCRQLYTPWWVPDCGHNDIDHNLKRAYYLKVTNFLKFVRNFNVDKTALDLDEFYKVESWSEEEFDHIYFKNLRKIEEKYDRMILKNPKITLKDQSFRSGDLTSSNRESKAAGELDVPELVKLKEEEEKCETSLIENETEETNTETEKRLSLKSRQSSKSVSSPQSYESPRKNEKSKEVSCAGYRTKSMKAEEFAFELGKFDFVNRKSMRETGNSEYRKLVVEDRSTEGMSEKCESPIKEIF